MLSKFCLVLLLLVADLTTPLFSQYNKTYNNKLGLALSYPLGVGLSYAHQNSSSPMSIGVQTRFYIHESTVESTKYLIVSGGFDYFFLQSDGFFMGLDVGHTFYQQEKSSTDSISINLEYFAFFLNPNLGYSYHIKRIFAKAELGYELEMTYKIKGSENSELTAVAIEYNSRAFKAKHHPSKPYASIAVGFRF
ncbi:MAG: hypothetical protein JEZ09_03230 [Salinivirgaceae bacterium]|nr:hypothetical protein [Salinivirgaceae bacterium]